MEKLGVRKDIQHQGLRDEEARLMQRVQSMDKEASENDRSELERRLQQVRQELTELDLGKK